jgi:ubiquinone/menaquinone biosynthesis C-methylase UbiE
MERKCVSVQEGYDRWGPTYDLDPNPLLALEERQLRLMMPPLQGKRALDLACGTGRWLSLLVSGGVSTAVGMDFSQAMLAVANRKTDVKGRIVCADCRALPFARLAFDLVICSFAVNHILDPEKLARQVWNVTVPGANVYLSDVHPLALARGWHTAFRDQQGPAEIATWPRPVEELRAVWEKSGFVYVESVDCRLGKQEKQILAGAGKVAWFEVTQSIPVVVLCHLQRLPY